jgi:hypothetical protein
MFIADIDRLAVGGLEVKARQLATSEPWIG